MQKMKAQMTQPVNTAEWIRCILLLQVPHSDDDTAMTNLLSWDAPNQRQNIAKQLIGTLDKFLGMYHNHRDVKSFDLDEKPAKRQRKSRRAAPTLEASDCTKEDSVKMGAWRQQAIRNVLNYGTAKGFRRWLDHLAWAGLFKYSALPDEVAKDIHIWPKSLPPSEFVPGEVDRIAIEAASRLTDHILASSPLTKGELVYNQPLTPEEHDAIVEKACNIYEEDAIHLTNLHDRAKLRPTLPKYHEYRMVIQHYFRTIQVVAKSDLSEEDFKTMDDAIRYGNSIDRQVPGCYCKQHLSVCFVCVCLPWGC
jgi:hypothetical protein